MANQPVIVSRVTKSLPFYLDAIWQNLEIAYCKMYPGKAEVDLTRDVLGNIATHHSTGDGLLKFFYEEQDGKASNAQLLCLACAYWSEAQQCLRDGMVHVAWSYAMDAMYYCAVVKTGSVPTQIQPLMQQVEAIKKEALQENAINAAMERNRLFNLAGEKAIQLIMERGKQGERWDSYREAARSVMNEVRVILAGTDSRYTAEDEGLQTIADRLSAVPEIATFIRTKRGRPSKVKQRAKAARTAASTAETK